MRSLENLKRRSVLSAAAAGVITGLAGCNSNEGDSESDSSPTETVVFTDSATQTATETATATPTQTATETATATPEKNVFDGGDLPSFIDSVSAADNLDSGLLRIEPGTYRFSPLDAANIPDSYHAAMANVSDVIIEGNGATFLFTDPLRGGLQFVNSENLTLQNLTIDYDPVPFTQGVLTDVSPDQETMTIELDATYPSLAHEMFSEAAGVWASVHNPDGSFVGGVKTTGTPRKLLSSIDAIGGRKFRLALRGGNISKAGLNAGNRLTIVARNNTTALTFNGVRDPKVQNITVHSSSGGAFTFPRCDSPRIVDSYIGPPPESSRQIGTDGDGIRIVNASGEPHVENCRADSLLDDNIVVQQVLHPIDSIINDSTVTLVDPLVFSVEEGNALQAMAPDGTVRDDLPSVTDVSESTTSGEEVVRIQFSSSIMDMLSEGDLLRNGANAPDNFTIRGNELRNNRGIQIRIAASNGVVEQNTLVGASRNAIELEVDTDGIFVPKGWVTNVTVRENTIRDVGLNYFAGDHPAGIRVHHLPKPDISTNGRPNKNITIADNQIEHIAGSGIEIEAAEDVTITNNDLQDLNNLSYPPGDYGMLFSEAKDVAVTENTVASPAERLEAFGWQRQSSGIELSKNELLIGGSSATVDIEKGQ